MTKIEWTKNDDGSDGKSWNPVTGCSQIAEGCRFCYAKRMSKRLAGRAGYPPAPDNFKVTLHPDRLDQPLHWRKPTKIFVCSMSDLFHEDVPDEFIWDVWNVMRGTPRHIFMILTKRPQRMYSLIEFWHMGFYENIRLGVSVSMQADADRNIPWLLRTPAAYRFVSAEPLLSEIKMPFVNTKLQRLNQVIIGCESGPGRRPMKLEWARDIVGQCREAGVDCFVKQIESDICPDCDGKAFVNVGIDRDYAFCATCRGEGKVKLHVERDMAKFPDDLRVRQ